MGGGGEGGRGRRRGRRYVIWSLQTLTSMSKEREDWFRFDVRDSPSCRVQLRGRGRFPAYRDAFGMQWWLICGLYQTRFDLIVVVVRYLHRQVLLERVPMSRDRKDHASIRIGVYVQVLLLQYNFLYIFFTFFNIKSYANGNIDFNFFLF